ncbi:MAG: hypothetical protein IKA61_01400 [Clostridia bacterium]|nr:hypothetical protein [Clostridia bacterium]
MKKTLSLLLALATAAACTACTNNGGSTSVKEEQLNAPIFERAEDGLQFSAYAPPPPESWSGSSGNPNCITDQNYSDLKEAGFNTIYALYEGCPIGSLKGNTAFEKIAYKSTFAEKHAIQALELAEKYDLKYWVRDWTFYGLVRELAAMGLTEKTEYEQVIDRMFSEDNPYIYSSAYGGNFGHDEPSVEEMDKIAWQVELYQKKMQERNLPNAEIYVNLLPCYASQVHLSSTDTTVDYVDYINHYMENLAPQLGYICYDYYPLRKDTYDRTYVRGTYLYNLELVARTCKEYEARTGQEIELRTFLQATSDFTGIRPLVGTADLRFQIYTEMAFGSKEFIYYTYSSEDPSEDMAIFDYMKNEKTWLYEAAKTVNNEVLAMQDAYLAYKWDNVMYKDGDPMVVNQGFANLASYLEKHDRFSIEDCTQDVLVGTFKGRKNSSDEAFMVVNYSDPGRDLDNKVTIKIEGAKGIVMYRLGQRIVYPLSADGTYTLNLLPGEGRFVIPIY